MSAEEQVTLEPPVAATSTEEFAKAPDSKADRTEYLRRVPFGSRYLTETDDVFSHNAWDHVVPPPEWEEEARQKLDFHRQHKVEEEKKEAYNSRPSYYWDKFYLAHKENFFKDRNWLRLEFPELLATSTVDAGPKKVVEIGCGAGNTVFPLLSVNENPDLVVHACDFSKRAVEVVKKNPLYPVPPHGKGILHASVWDLSTPPVTSQSQAPGATSTQDPVEELGDALRPTSLPEGVEPNSVDIAILIFVMSALHPHEWQRAVANVWKMLKPGGMAFIRDYGRYDLAQLRIKKGRMLDENFYIRGDGTRVYFFDAADLSEMLTGSKTAYTPEDMVEPTVEEEDLTPADAQALDSPMPTTPAEPEDYVVDERSGVKLESGKPLSTRFQAPSPSIDPKDYLPRKDYPIHQTPTIRDEAANEGDKIDPFMTPHEELGVPANPLFRIEQLGVDRRLMVNRKEQIKMYRIWMQVKAYKLPSS